MRVADGLHHTQGSGRHGGAGVFCGKLQDSGQSKRRKRAGKVPKSHPFAVQVHTESSKPRLYATA